MCDDDDDVFCVWCGDVFCVWYDDDDAFCDLGVWCGRRAPPTFFARSACKAARASRTLSDFSSSINFFFAAEGSPIAVVAGACSGASAAALRAAALLPPSGFLLIEKMDGHRRPVPVDPACLIIIYTKKIIRSFSTSPYQAFMVNIYI